jgi:hypothetical protein
MISESGFIHACTVVGQVLRGVVPVQASDLAVFLLVGISPAIIPIACELGVRAWIVPQPGYFSWLIGTLDRFSQWQY